MRIKSLYCKSHFFEWEIEEIDFSDSNTTLLVGISGVGKTQILEAISNLQYIAEGETINGFEWKVGFEIEGIDYIWQGAFDSAELFEENIQLVNNKSYPLRVRFEQLRIEDDLVIDRNRNKTVFQQKELPKLLSSKSSVNMLGEEPVIQPIIEGLRKVVLYRSKTSIGNLSIGEGVSLGIIKKYHYNTLKKIINSKQSVFNKLAICFFHFKDTFQQIIVDFKDVFPQVEDVRFKLKSSETEEEGRHYILQLKEKEVDRWIDSQSISAGMQKTLLHIADLYLTPENGILLIDEFENSLGVNCIDLLAENLIFERDDVQVILTSHHPYIINKIPVQYWKVVTRKGGKIKTYAAEEFDLGRSHHEHFLSLLNLPEYKTGVPSSAL